jgi:hypothetical protein
VIVVAAVFAAIGVAIIGGWWIAADQRGDGRRPATTVTAHEAARVVARALVREFEAGRASADAALQARYTAATVLVRLCPSLDRCHCGRADLGTADRPTPNPMYRQERGGRPLDD